MTEIIKMTKISSYLSKDFDRSRFNSSAEALGFSPIKPVDKLDAVSCVQNKAKHMKAGLNEKLANVMEISHEELNERNLNDCTNCKKFLWGQFSEMGSIFGWLYLGNNK